MPFAVGGCDTLGEAVKGDGGGFAVSVEAPSDRLTSGVETVAEFDGSVGAAFVEEAAGFGGSGLSDIGTGAESSVSGDDSLGGVSGMLRI